MRNLVLIASMAILTHTAVSQETTLPAPVALNQMTDMKFSDEQMKRLEKKIESPRAQGKGGSPNLPTDVDLNDLYRKLVEFSGNRETYTLAISHYVKVYEEHTGLVGVLYRDQAYSQLVQSAQDLENSLRGLMQYLSEKGLAIHADTVAIDAVLHVYGASRGVELHSVTDEVKVGGLTLDQLKDLSARAAQNGEILQSQIIVLQKMLLEKGANLGPPHRQALP